MPESPDKLPTSYSVTEAAMLLGVNEKTIRRRIGDDLERSGDQSPTRLTAASVQQARRRLAQQLGMYLDPPTVCQHPSVEQLQIENERLRVTAQALRMSLLHITESLGDYIQPTIPNN